MSHPLRNLFKNAYTGSKADCCVSVTRRILTVYGIKQPSQGLLTEVFPVLWNFGYDVAVRIGNLNILYPNFRI